MKRTSVYSDSAISFPSSLVVYFFTAAIQLEHKVPTSADENNIKSREQIRQVALVFCPSLSIIEMDLKQLIVGWLAMVYDGRRHG